MNLNELSQKLEDHLTDQDIQDAQELLDDTYQEIVDMRGELVEAQAELAALRTQAITDAAEIERLKAQNAELLAAQEGTPCNHKFNAVFGGVLSCIHCYASFSDQKEVTAKV